MSTAAGEYVSVSSQSDTEQANLARERKPTAVAAINKENRHGNVEVDQSHLVAKTLLVERSDIRGYIVRLFGG